MEVYRLAREFFLVPGSLVLVPASPGLLRLPGCDNLDFCAVLRAERECVRADFGTPEGLPGG